jgi:hypothetical protein
MYWICKHWPTYRSLSVVDERFGDGALIDDRKRIAELKRV